MIYSIFYNIFIQLYKTATKTAAGFNQKAGQRIEGLKANAVVLEKLIADKSNSKNWQLAWFHAASLGEFEQARPVLEDFKKQHPGHKILLTFFSPSGFEIRKNYAEADYITYLPFDLPDEMETFISAVEPSIVFWVKYEYWRNCLRMLAERNVPVYLFSAIFRENQPFFKFYGESFAKTLTYFKHLFVQDESSAKLLQTIGIDNVTVAGDTRFDRVADTLKTVREIEIIERFKGKQQLLVIGSAWEADVECVMNGLKLSNFSNLKVVIAPHELHEEQIKRWKTAFNSVRYSEVTPNADLSNFPVLLIDNIGLLSSIYQYADAAFIGGAFGKGLHNILEAATFGMPLFFGNKNYQKFREATNLIEKDGAFVVASAEEFKTTFTDKMRIKAEISTKVRNYVLENTGATTRMLTQINVATSNK